MKCQDEILTRDGSITNKAAPEEKYKTSAALSTDYIEEEMSHSPIILLLLNVHVAYHNVDNRIKINLSQTTEKVD